MKNTTRQMSLLMIFTIILWIGSTLNPLGWSIVGILLSFLITSLFLNKPKLSIPSKSVSILCLLFMLWSTFSLFYSPNIHSALFGLLKIGAVIMGCVVFMNEKEEWDDILVWSVMATTCMAAMLWLFIPGFRAFIRYPNLFAGFLSMAGVLSFGQIISGNKKRYYFETITCTLVGICLLSISSLGPVLAGGSGIGTLMVSSYRRIPSTRRFIIYAVLGLIFILLVSLIPYTSNFFYKPDARKINKDTLSPSLSYYISVLPFKRNRFHHLWERKITDRFSGERIQIWKDSLEMIKAHIWKGVGIGSYSEVYPQYKNTSELRTAPHAHNEILQLLAEHGLIGVILLLALGLILLRNPIPSKNVSSNVWLAVMITAFVQSLFDMNLRYPPISVFSAFCLSRFIPLRVLNNPLTNIRFIPKIVCFILTLLFLLPGLAFLVNFYGNSALARQLDPLNGHYWSKSQRMRDLEIAIYLEPRNVWYRRRAAHFYKREWERSGHLESLKKSLNELEIINQLAPRVDLLNKEKNSVNQLYESISKP